MSYLYVCEQGATIGISENRFQVKYKDGMVKSIPAETLEVIEVFGKVQITTQCVTECLKRGVNIIFYSTYGAYFGRLISTNHVNVQRDVYKRQEPGCNYKDKCYNTAGLHSGSIVCMTTHLNDREEKP